MVDARELGPLEVRVLGLLRKGEPTPVGVIRERLEREGAPLAYTTVMTVLSRLHDKGLATRKREGNRFLYAPATGAPPVLEGMLSRVRRALSANSRAQPLLALLEEDDLSAAELRTLRRAIDRKLQEKKR